MQAQLKIPLLAPVEVAVRVLTASAILNATAERPQNRAIANGVSES
jgi:hypothetical protein